MNVINDVWTNHPINIGTSPYVFALNSPLIVKDVLYKKNKQVAMKGFFKDVNLINGKKYLYDEKGKLKNIEVYKNCKYIEDGLI
jgi:antitoxin component YwqK of YwqJK toxin-antitoxin module